ncbi:MAG: ABC transporter ATP-binding protein [Alphaproteobacteria bacterium]
MSVLRGASFDVASGRITALIGPNGAGKTTLFNIIAGFLAPDAGTIELKGRPVTGLPPDRLFRLGLVRTFQIPQIFARLSVRDNLMIVPAGQKGEALWRVFLQPGAVHAQDALIRARVAGVLEALRLDHLAAEPAGNLSGGQKKLLELGRVMLAGADVVLLDEPGAGVNRTLLATLAADIERLNREHGLTFLVIEHDMDLVARMCNPVVVMAEGQVIASGSIDQIRANRTVIDAYLGGQVSA